MSIKELIKDYEIIDFFLVKEIKIKEAYNGKYLDLILIDSSGIIQGKYWRCNLKEVNNISRGSIIKIKAKVEEYKGKLQLNINKIRLVEKSDNIKKDYFIKKAKIEINMIYKNILDEIENIKNKEIKKIVLARIKETKKKLLYYPAAKFIHHNYKGGLIFHTNSMIKIAKSIIPLYDFLDKDLIIAGIILHDLNKTEEMIADEIGVEEYSLEGVLLGHLVLGVNSIERLCSKFKIKKEIKVILSHIILSHHFKNEYGSPVQPMIPEAELIHFIDMIDSRMNQLENVYENIKPGSFSEKIFSLENRKFYNPTWK